MLPKPFPRRMGGLYCRAEVLKVPAVTGVDQSSFLICVIKLLYALFQLGKCGALATVCGAPCSLPLPAQQALASQKIRKLTNSGRLT
jgi:hypothetical protein